MVSSIRIHRMATSTREFNVVSVVIGDLHLRCDMVSSREVRLAYRLASENGIQVSVCPNLKDLVETAMGHEIMSESENDPIAAIARIETVLKEFEGMSSDSYKYMAANIRSAIKGVGP